MAAAHAAHWPLPSLRPALAHAWSGRRERYRRSKACMHIFPRTARQPARHRSPRNAPHSPSTLGHLILPAVTRKSCTSTEPLLLPVGTARAQAPHSHRRTKTTTSSPAHRPNHPIVSDESTLNRAHREQIKPRTPSPRPLCSSFSPLSTPLSSASSHTDSHLLPRRAPP
jgi:hypothetical protein